MDSKEKKKKMTKTHKAVLSTLAVLCLLFMGSGVAQAQECFAFQSGANTVRAEGMTEAVGSIQLQCRDQTGFGVPPIGDEAVISITLNTAITNETNDAMVIWSWASPTLMVPQWPPLPLGTPTIIRGRVRKYSRTVAPRSRGLSPPRPTISRGGGIMFPTG